MLKDGKPFYAKFETKTFSSARLKFEVYQKYLWILIKDQIRHKLTEVF